MLKINQASDGSKNLIYRVLSGYFAIHDPLQLNVVNNILPSITDSTDVWTVLYGNWINQLQTTVLTATY